MTRHLRIAVALVFALLAVTFVALWVRSYSYTEGVNGPVGVHYFAGVEHGRGLIIGDLSRWPKRPDGLNQWNRPSSALGPLDIESLNYWWSETPLGLGFYFHVRPNNGLAFAFPHCFAVAVCAGLATALVLVRTWRFSLRTIVVATTLLAAILGLAVYLV